MVNMVEKVRLARRLKDFVTKFNESSRAFLAQHYANSRGRYMIIAQYWGETSESGGDGAGMGEWRGLGLDFACVLGSYQFFCCRRQG